MVSSISAEIIARRSAKQVTGAATSFLVLDTESIPDGRLLAKVKYPGENLTAEAAIERAQAEARDQSRDGSDFLPVTFQIPIAVCVLRVANDFGIQALKCLDEPEYRTKEIVQQFWKGVGHYPRAKLVTFNGRGFDMPLLELAAFDHGISARDYFASSRNRYQGNHLDLFDWLTNFGAFRLVGGLNMMAQRGDAPRGCGKLGVDGSQVYALYKAGRVREINEYCMFDTLDTYFIFLRTRVMLGEMTLEQEQHVVRRARTWLAAKSIETPPLRQYLEKWEQFNDRQLEVLSYPVRNPEQAAE
jgi:predicted PolB exonuclease-like 3'-5' exonuclease